MVVIVVGVSVLEEVDNMQRLTINMLWMLSNPESFASGLHGTMSIPGGPGTGEPVPWSATAGVFYVHSGDEYERKISAWGANAAVTAVGGKNPISWAVSRDGGGSGNLPSTFPDGRTVSFGETGGDGENPVEPGTYTVAATDKDGLTDSMKVVLVRVMLTRTPKKWLPKGGKKWKDGNKRKYLATILPSGIKGKLKFSLSQVSHYKGYCSNAGKKVTRDLRFKPNQNGFSETGNETLETVEEVESKNIVVQCKDYGAHGRLRAETVTVEGETLSVVAKIEEDDGDIHEYVTIPRDEDGDGMADSWERKYVKKSKELKKIEDLTPGYDKDYALGNPKKNLHGKRYGDAIRAFDEYRGFMIAKGKKKHKHKRTSPIIKDLFIYNPLDFNPRKGYHRIRVVPSVFNEIGYNVIFINSTKFFRADRRIAFNGRSPQRIITIKGDYTESGGDFGSNDGYARPGTPMTCGDITIYFLVLAQAGANGKFRTNVLDHEVGHSCYLWHHSMYYLCLMDALQRSSSSITDFDYKYTIKRTKIK